MQFLTNHIATDIGKMYAGTSILYTKVTPIHYQTLSEKDATWKIDVNNLSVRSLHGLLLLFLHKRDDFANKNEEFYNPSIKKILITINGMNIPVMVAVMINPSLIESSTFFSNQNYSFIVQVL